jgi:hypothetical protein
VGGYLSTDPFIYQLVYVSIFLFCLFLNVVCVQILLNNSTCLPCLAISILIDALSILSNYLI